MNLYGHEPTRIWTYTDTNLHGHKSARTRIYTDADLYRHDPTRTWIYIDRNQNWHELTRTQTYTSAFLLRIVIYSPSNQTQSVAVIVRAIVCQSWLADVCLCITHWVIKCTQWTYLLNNRHAWLGRIKRRQCSGNWASGVWKLGHRLQHADNGRTLVGAQYVFLSQSWWWTHFGTDPYCYSISWPCSSRA